MGIVVFRIAAGCGFILFGRWAYRNPRKVVAQMSLANPQNRAANGLVRAWSLLIIFGGCYAILLPATAELSKGLGGVFPGAGLSAALAWYVRPRLPKAAQMETVSQGSGGILMARTDGLSG